MLFVKENHSLDNTTHVFIVWETAQLVSNNNGDSYVTKQAACLITLVYLCQNPFNLYAKAISSLKF